MLRLVSLDASHFTIARFNLSVSVRGHPCCRRPMSRCGRAGRSCHTAASRRRRTTARARSRSVSPAGPKLGQLRPIMAVFLRERAGQLASFGLAVPTPPSLQRRCPGPAHLEAPEGAGLVEALWRGRRRADRGVAGRVLRGGHLGSGHSVVSEKETPSMIVRGSGIRLHWMFVDLRS